MTSAPHLAESGEPVRSRSRRAQQSIQDRIKDLIFERRLVAGDAMPTENELVDYLGVSRNTVREALKALQAVRIVEIRHGFGTYVGDCSLDPFADALAFRGRQALHTDLHEVVELIELRQALEVGLVEQIARVADGAEIAALGDRLGAMADATGSDEQFAAADRAFHDQLYAPLDNQLLIQLLRVFWDVYHELSRSLPGAPPDYAEIVTAHRAIYEAVAAGDGERAREAMAGHFGGIRARLAHG